MLPKFFAGLVLALSFTLSALPAQAGLSTDLQNLVVQGTALRANLATISVSQGNTCTQLGGFNVSLENYLASIQGVYGQLAAPITLTATDLTALDTLSGLAKGMATDSVRLSLELRNIEALADLFEYRAALSAMLRLSDDVGIMANRILEMADRILVMADNIGAMADRIVLTQQLQSTNVALTQASMLTTQLNMIAMSESLSTIAYNLSLGLVVNESNALMGELGRTTLTSQTMAVDLSRLEAQSALLLNSTVSLYSWMSQNSQVASHYINGDTLTLLGDLSSLQMALAFSLEAYANTINQLAPLTQIPVLSDATASMLRLTADIGEMSGRIMEMTDKIIVMADNIGLMADRIVVTQNLQQANIELTQNSVNIAQNVTITVIQNYLGQ
ncbi:MAG: hypothetical protein KKH22_02745 [Proteobacteria bacterium]|nr:hypothetical protein [Pseudomonadota bacterium]